VAASRQDRSRARPTRRGPFHAQAQGSGQPLSGSKQKAACRASRGAALAALASVGAMQPTQGSRPGAGSRRAGPVVWPCDHTTSVSDVSELVYKCSASTEIADRERRILASSAQPAVDVRGGRSIPPVGSVLVQGSGSRSDERHSVNNVPLTCLSQGLFVSQMQLTRVAVEHIILLDQSGSSSRPCG
jgi:hypothetical protein